MKTSLLLLLLSLPLVATAESSLSMPVAVPLQGYEGIITQTDNTLIGGQPSAAALKAAAAAGIKAVISLRTDREHADHDTVPFDEKAVSAEAGLDFYQLPLGSDDSYTPELLATFNRLYDQYNGQVLLHCRSGRRTSYLWTAWLVRYKGMSLAEAQIHGEAINLGNSPLEGLLNADLELAYKNSNTN
ncbi:MAG: dual specificity protein phosphatase family protein [Pseudomonadales bacterium]|nr:dual specificity protein phosphatase family protein [Pseudomonadales bacterium]